MAGSTFGTNFRITTFGESHGKALGVIVDGCPAGLELNEDDIQKYLDRRKPGQSAYTTKRAESDTVEILSGVFDGKTTGTPISLMVRNTDHHSTDYSEIASYYRPGHADYTFDEKYGFRDYRGGGRSSGRETIGRVAAGAIAAKVLATLSIKIETYAKSIGPVSTENRNDFDINEKNNNPFCMPSKSAASETKDYLDGIIKECNSSGGVIECVVKGLMPGIGEPVFDKLDAELAKAVMSIGAVKAFEIGIGTDAGAATGLECNDEFIIRDETIKKATNNAGGTLGGISDGSDLVFRAHVKPTPSVSATQKTVNKSMNEIDINIKGRHDPIIVPRAVVVVESMAAITVLDLLMRNMSSKMENLIKIYK